MIQESLRVYIDLFAKVFRLLGLPDIKTGKESQTIDERILKIELAKKNLLESLNAIEELKKEAENNKVEFQKTIEELNKVKLDKTTLETEYNSLKQLSTKDLNTIKGIIGIPDKNRERLIGFATGVITSLIASGIIYIIQHWFAGKLS
jgi:hypothetical protein